MNEQLQQLVIQLVQAAMQGDQKAQQTIEQIMGAAQQGDQQATQIAQMIQAIALQMQQGLVQAAKFGAKLDYTRQLRGLCPEGYEMKYFKSGGRLCKKCIAKQKKMEEGGEVPSNPVDSFKCGRKMKKVKKAEDGITFEFENPRVTAAKQENAYHAKMADNYFDTLDSDNLGYWDKTVNAAKGAYHWLTSKPYLFGLGESGALTGMAPVPGKIKGAKAIKAAKTAKAIKQESLTKAKDLYRQLTPAELANFNVYLRNSGKKLDDMSDPEIFEMNRIIRYRTKPISSDPGPEGSSHISPGWRDMSKDI